MLAASGKLNLAAGGPSDADFDASRRRSLYLRQHRERFPDQQVLFDSGGGVVSCSRRNVSTNALQPMWLLNSQFSLDASKALAEQAGSVGQAFLICLGREASPRELAALQSHARQHGLASACLVLMNMNEFLYIP
jgi:hypothetical protein